MSFTTKSCVKLPITNATQFCGITEYWKPIISKDHELTYYLVLSLLPIGTFFLVAAILYCGMKSFKESKGKIGIIFQVFWDSIDAAVDGILYVYFAINGILEGKVSLNSHVKNAMFAFAIIGSLKIFLWLLVVYTINKNNKGKDDETKLANKHKTQMIMLLIAFVLEDGPEVILEYFYFERYYTADEPWYLLIKDGIFCFLAFWTFCKDICWICRCKPKSCSWYILSILNVCISALMVTRFVGAVYQIDTGEFQQECFDVRDGALIQTPFRKECLEASKFGIPILAMFGLSIFILMILLFVLCCRRRDSD